MILLDLIDEICNYGGIAYPLSGDLGKYERNKLSG
jgi:hypothetical protein